MTMSLIFFCFWLLTAGFYGAYPSRSNHWRGAYALIAVGLPIVGYVFYENGPWIGLFACAVACSVLRWPILFCLRWGYGKLQSLAARRRG